MSDLRPPCFRNIEEQADCPEILQRRSSGDETLLTMMCGALAGSFRRKPPKRRGRGGGSRRRLAGRLPYPGRLRTDTYSSAQARWQSEIWSRYGRTGLARRFREAAKEAEQASRSRRRMRRLVPILALGLVVAAVGVARLLLTWSARQPTEVAMQASGAGRAAVGCCGGHRRAAEPASHRCRLRSRPSSATRRVRARGFAFARGCAIGVRGAIDGTGTIKSTSARSSHRRHPPPSTMPRRLSPHRRRSLSRSPKWYRFRVAH